MINRTQAALATAPSIAGVGISMEGIDQNPPYYSLVLDTNWIPANVSLKAEYWLVEWGRTRCGRLTSNVEAGERV